MKKIMISLLCVAATMNIMAAVTANVSLKITAVDGGDDFVLTLVQNDALADGVAGTGSAVLNPEGLDMYLIADFNGKDYHVLAVKSLKDIPLVLKANASTTYKLDVVSATGEVQYLKDLNGSPLELSAGKSYTFSIDPVEAGHLVAARFSIGDPTPDPGEPKICFVNKHLIVENATVDIQVLNEDKTLYMEYPATSTDIDLSGAPVNPSPYYWVVFEGDEMKINLNPTLE